MIIDKTKNSLEIKGGFQLFKAPELTVMKKLTLQEHGLYTELRQMANYQTGQLQITHSQIATIGTQFGWISKNRDQKGMSQNEAINFVKKLLRNNMITKDESSICFIFYLKNELQANYKQITNDLQSKSVDNVSNSNSGYKQITNDLQENYKSGAYTILDQLISNNINNSMSEKTSFSDVEENDSKIEIEEIQPVISESESIPAEENQPKVKAPTKTQLQNEVNKKIAYRLYDFYKACFPKSSAKIDAVEKIIKKTLKLGYTEQELKNSIMGLKIDLDGFMAKNSYTAPRFCFQVTDEKNYVDARIAMFNQNEVLGYKDKILLVQRKGAWAEILRIKSNEYKPQDGDIVLNPVDVLLYPNKPVDNGFDNNLGW